MLSYRSASPGYWTAWLLPLAIFLSSPTPSSTVFLGTIIYNTVITTLLHLYEFDFTVALEGARNLYLVFATAVFSLFWNLGCEAYVVFTFVSLAFAYPFVFYNIVRYYPRSFTFGEAQIVTQAFLLTFWHCVSTVPTPPVVLTKAANVDIVILYAEAGFLGVMIVTRLLVISTKPWKFLLTEEFFCVWGKCSLAALLFRLTTDDLWYLPAWLGTFLMDRIILFMYCAACITLAFGFVYLKNVTRNQASTTDRKYFHFLILAVYLPGIFVDREFLYMGSVATMYIFVMTELIRSLKLKIFGSTVGEKINDSIGVFRDHQDEGKLIVTPLYLLAGCSLPVWLIGLSTPTTQLRGYELAAAISGLLSIGVGDTFASIGGTAFGNIRWSGTNKSFGGTVFCIVSQVCFTFLLYLFGAFSGMVTLTVIFAAFVNSMVEALTDQIDNLILPLLTFDIILLVNFFVFISTVLVS